MEYGFKKRALSALLAEPESRPGKTWTGRGRRLAFPGGQTPVSDHLDYLFAGTVPDHPSRLLLHDRIRKLMEEVKEQYDFIFMDCVPYSPWRMRASSPGWPTSRCTSCGRLREEA